MKRTCSTLILFICVVVLLSCKRARSRFEHAYEEEPQIEDVQENQVTIIGSPDTSHVAIKYERTDSSFCIYGYPILAEGTPRQILSRIAYVTSYNNSTKCPNWVAWHLTKEYEDGPYSRHGVPYYGESGETLGIGMITKQTQRGDYFQDMECQQPRQLLTDWDHRDNNLTHGHICPAADNRWSKAAMNQSFLLTNMCPQDGSLNGGAWQKLEEKCRTWARLYNNIYIISGPIYNNGKFNRTMGRSKVAVPDGFFKIVLRIQDMPIVIGFVYRNDDTSQNMRQAACSVDDVEQLTGMDFFINLPDDVENEIESHFSTKSWNIN